MTTLGKYCRAYPLSRLRQFPGWSEKAENARRVTKLVNGETVEVARELTDADYVYLHTDFTVTDGIFIDENIIFTDVTPEWIEFCHTFLAHDPSVNGPKQMRENGNAGG
jgi:hypothetical protein